ncbi:MAG: hypothetical protein EA355_14535 [Rhodobacteraceae bacterium]|nr:MAG: hypothetical protein EA355_14535 [Paracoccaceae bacterium]
MSTGLLEAIVITFYAIVHVLVIGSIVLRYREKRNLANIALRVSGLLLIANVALIVIIANSAY